MICVTELNNGKIRFKFYLCNLNKRFEYEMSMIAEYKHA